MISSLSKLWKILGKKTQWRLMWLAHSKFNVGISIIIPDKDGRLLLAKHVFSGEKPWRLVGGYINKNENIYDAAKREAKEELGLDIEIERVLRIRSGFAFRIEITLVAEPVSSESILTLDTKEIIEAGWFSLAQEPVDTLDSHVYLLKLYREKPAGYVEIRNI